MSLKVQVLMQNMLGNDLYDVNDRDGYFGTLPVLAGSGW